MLSQAHLDKIIARTYNKTEYGLVAQLGEHTVRIRKVEGSIPFESTNSRSFIGCGCFLTEQEKLP